MRRKHAQVTIWGAVAAVLIHALSAQALGLGEIQVDSQLNQQFSAVIPLTEIDSDDLETVVVSVAPAEAFERAGVDRADYLSSLDFTVRNDRGQPRVVVSSAEIAREPVLNLLVQARWAQGKILREYTVLLDPPLPPKAPVRSVVASTPVAAPEPAPAPIVAAPKPLPTAPKPAPAQPSPMSPAPAAIPVPVKPEPEFYETAAEGGRAATKPVAKPPLASTAPATSIPSGATYGPVKAQETLWSIATRFRPDSSVSMDQVIYALAQANPKTIQRATTVNKGAVLSIPDADTMRQLGAMEAKSRLAALRGTPAAAVPTAKASAATPSAVEPPAPAKLPSLKGSILAGAPPSAAKPDPPPVAPKPSAQTPPSVKPEPPKPEPVKAAPTSAPPAVKPELSKVDPFKPAAAPKPPVVEPAKIEPVKPEPAPVAPKPSPAAPSEAKPAVAPPPMEPVVEPTAAPPPAAETPTAPAEVTDSGAAVASPEAPPAPAPEKKLRISQPVPEDSASGISDLLSEWSVPLVGLLVLVLAVLGMLQVMRKGGGSGLRNPLAGKTKPEKKSAAGFAAAAAAPAASKMGDTLVRAPRAADATQNLDQTQSITQQITQRIDAGQAGNAKPSAFESTLIIEPEVAASLQASTQPSAVSHNKLDFDMTTQLQAETMHISLDANDPVSEADFHLAYGLYDEAILLLRQAAAKTPGRLDIQVKLAETYFAAGKPLEFQTLAEDLKPRIDPAEWSKIAIMGAQLCPGVALFKAEDGAALEADFDLGFDEPELPAAPAVLDLPPMTPPPVASAPTPMANPSMALEIPDLSIPMAVGQDASALDDLKADLKLELDPELIGADVKDIPEEDPNSIDFMLGQSITPLGAAGDAPPPSLDSNLLEFDLDSSLSEPKSGKAPGVVDELPGMGMDLELSLSAPMPATKAEFEDMARDLKMAEFEISLTPREPDAAAIEDEYNTKLDLARAYVEMGDNEMARGLLQEVQQQGTELQQREAGEMLQRLPA